MVDVTDVSEYMGLGLGPRTAYSYARVIQRVLPLLEARGVDLLTCSAADVAVVSDGWAKSHSSRSQLRSALVAAWDLVGRESTPTRAVRVPPKPRMRSKALDDPEAARLEQVAIARADLAGLAVLLGLYLGLRREEIASLRSDAFDRQSDGLWATVMGKGDVVGRIPVHRVLAEALERLGPFGQWVFPAVRGGHVCPATVWNWTRQVATEAGLGNVAPHRLRHTSLTVMNELSRDLRAVQEIARHSKPEITAGYTRVRDRRMREIVEMIDYASALDDEEEAS